MSDTDTRLTAFTMPSLGSDMDAGSIIEWLVDVGDQVERGQVVARVETEKSDIDVEIWHSGVVSEIVVGPDETVPVGTVLMRFRADDSGSPAGPAADPAEPARLVEPARPTGTAEPADVARVDIGPRRADDRSGHVVWASPLARRLAGERGIELSDVVGSGPGGAIRSTDLAGIETATRRDPNGDEAAAPQSDGSDPREQGVSDAASRQDRMRSMIAVRMTRSNAEIPHYRLQYDIDLGPLTEHLASINATRSITERIVPAAAFVRSVALAARRHPELNGMWSDGGFRPGLGVNVSVAISLRGGGLVTPTIHHADEVSLDETMELLREFTVAARRGVMRAQWTANDSTITVTNLGDRGADSVHGLISPPEVALVGFGRVADRPFVVDGELAVRPVVIATLGADHRATDGAVGSRFLSTLAHHLEHPEEL